LAAICANCGSAVGTMRRLRGATLCESCERRESQQRQTATEEMEALIAQALAAPDPSAVVSQLPAVVARTGLSGPQVDREMNRAVRQMIERALEDEYLTEEEEAAINRAINALGFDQDRAGRVLGDLANRFVIARVNAGRLPELPSSSVMLKPGETAHLEITAHLMKEVVTARRRRSFGSPTVTW
jgi:hypothetical protein